MTCPACGKHCYPSERAARSAMRSIKVKRRDGWGHLHAYRCGGSWHVGHGHRSEPSVPGRKFRL